MKKITLILAILILFFSGILQAECPEECRPINIVNYQLNLEQWATTQTAKVIIQFDGALTAKGSEDLQKTILQKLTVLSHTGQWNITNVIQAKDSSDLQRIAMQAEARLPISEVSNLQDKVKLMSRPGATFTVANIDFSPSLDDMQQVKAALRSQLYQMAKEELQKLNQLYAPAHFVLHKIEMIDGVPPVYLAGDGAGNNMVMARMEGSPAAPSPSMAVNRKIQMSARIEFASELGKGADK